MLISNLLPTLLEFLSGGGPNRAPSEPPLSLQLGQVLTGRVLATLSSGKAVVQFEGGKIVVESPALLVRGQTLTVQVEQLFPAPVLKQLHPQSGTARGNPVPGSRPENPDVRLQIITGRDRLVKTFQAAELSRLNLSPGKPVRGEVVRLADEQTVVIRFGKAEFAVHHPVDPPPRVGSQLIAHLQRFEDGFRLVSENVIGGLSKGSGGGVNPYLISRRLFVESLIRLEEFILRSPIMERLNIEPELIQRLRETLRLLVPVEKTPSPNGETLRQQVDRTGIHYEAKVKQFLEGNRTAQLRADLNQDLKGQLLELARKIEMESFRGETSPKEPVSGISGKQAADFLQTVRQAVDHIEFLQLSHHVARQENQPVLLQIPNPFVPGEPPVKIFMRTPKDSKGKGKGDDAPGFLMVFILSLTALGDLRVDARVRGETVSINFSVENASIADWIESRVSEFQSRMSTLGFQAELSCYVGEKTNLAEMENELTGLPVEGGAPLVDVKT